MLNKIIITLLIVNLLSACSSDPNSTGLMIDGKLNNVKVIDKRTERYNGYADNFFVSFGKNGESVEFQVDEKLYNMLNKELTVNLSYNTSYRRIVKIEFPNLEGDSNE